MENCETIFFLTDKYNDEPEQKVSAADSAFVNLIKILLKNDYQCTIYPQDFGAIAIEYNYAPYCNFENPTCEWVTPEEIELIRELRRQKDSASKEE